MKQVLEDQINALASLTVGQLLERYAEVWGERARSRHRMYLLRRIAWKMQANAEGGISERALRRAQELADESEVRLTPPRVAPAPDLHVPARRVELLPAADPRLPSPGTAISRQYKGATIRVLVHADGLEWGGRRYKSLSAVAKAVTGSHINGYRFFGLGGGR